MSPHKHDLAYSAGLMDGEGTITMRPTGKWRRPRVSMSSTTLCLLEYMVATFGGAVYARKRARAVDAPSWSWALNGEDAIKFIQITLPYMREPAKIRRANMILLEYPHTNTEAQRLDFEQRFFDGPYYAEVAD